MSHTYYKRFQQRTYIIKIIIFNNYFSPPLPSGLPRERIRAMRENPDRKSGRLQGRSNSPSSKRPDWPGHLSHAYLVSGWGIHSPKSMEAATLRVGACEKELFFAVVWPRIHEKRCYENRLSITKAYKTTQTEIQVPISSACCLCTTFKSATN